MESARLHAFLAWLNEDEEPEVPRYTATLDPVQRWTRDELAAARALVTRNPCAALRFSARMQARIGALFSPGAPGSPLEREIEAVALLEAATLLGVTSTVEQGLVLPRLRTSAAAVAERVLADGDAATALS